MSHSFTKIAIPAGLIAAAFLLSAYGDLPAQQQQTDEVSEETSERRYEISAFTSSGIIGPHGVFHPPYHGAYVVDTHTGDVHFVQQNGTIKHVGSVAKHD